MLLISLMRSTPGFWMPERRNQPSSGRASTGTTAIPRCAGMNGHLSRREEITAVDEFGNRGWREMAWSEASGDDDPAGMRRLPRAGRPGAVRQEEESSGASSFSGTRVRGLPDCPDLRAQRERSPIGASGHTPVSGHWVNVRRRMPLAGCWADTPASRPTGSRRVPARRRPPPPAAVSDTRGAGRACAAGAALSTPA